MCDRCVTRLACCMLHVVVATQSQFTRTIHIIDKLATLDGMHHILNTPNLVSGMGAFSEALMAMPST